MEGEGGQGEPQIWYYTLLYRFIPFCFLLFPVILNYTEFPPKSKGRLMDRLLNPKEVAELLGVPLSMVYKMTREKTIPFYKIGKYIRFQESVVDQWLQKKEV